MHRSRATPRPNTLQRGCRWAGVIVWTLWAIAGAAGAMGATLPERLHAARDLAGVDPQRAVKSLQPLREAALAEQRLDWRLMADEIECRILGDLDNRQALDVADAGLAAAGPSPADTARLPWLRLRACRAGVLIDGGIDPAGGDREIEAVLAASQDPALRDAASLALLERGVRRSRTGDLVRGQQDLLAACGALDEQKTPRDLELCLGHLANHYKRMGDFDESLRLLGRLRDGAQRRGADFDEAIMAFGIAQTHAMRKDWPAALREFGASATVYKRLDDRSGLAYAEHGTAGALLAMGDPAMALQHADAALLLLLKQDDPRQTEKVTITRAQALSALGRPADALADLLRIEPHLKPSGNVLSLADWWSAKAEAHRALGQWHEAYEAMAQWRKLNTQVEEQRQSEQAARLRMQFNRDRDAEDLDTLRRLNAQGQRLRQTQAVALGLFLLLLAAASTLAWRKFAQARQLQGLASTDELTGLPNRRSVLARAEQALRQARSGRDPMAVLMIDLDHFKSINDLHGHASGDEVLRHTARLLPAGLQAQDCVGRLGGEEFLAVLPGASAARARQVAEGMCQALAATPVVTDRGELHITVSIGVALGHGPDVTVSSLLERADAAMYRAKAGGRNRVAVEGDREA